jgi:RecJ-like exonuclease
MESEAPDPHGLAPGDEGPPEEKSVGGNVCPDCDGTGQREGRDCPNCGGTGRVEEAVGGG